MPEEGEQGVPPGLGVAEGSEKGITSRKARAGLLEGLGEAEQQTCPPAPQRLAVLCSQGIAALAGGPAPPSPKVPLPPVRLD